MARMARLKFSDRDTWYHLYSRVPAHRDELPLAKLLVQRQLISTIKHYCSIYFCHVAALCVMGNHYHLVLRFDAEREVDREELRARSRLMYPSAKAQQQIDLWDDERWEHYRRRLFDVSELMRNVQAAFARWYNRSFDRRGRLWDQRFKSTVLGDARAVLDCLLYVELNPVRAGIVERPEEWEASSVYLREIGQDGWLIPIEELFHQPDRKSAMLELRQLLYHRGAVPTREGQAAISPEILEQEAARGYESSGVFRKRLVYFVEGVAIGTEAFLREQIGLLREQGRYRRRKNPIRQLGGVHLSLREQRSNAIIF
ncbi:MAG: hypothetical protein GXP47_08715 [Acidobacteria bacterium]|nr:hypothetical protein [Acidobacteriota bacterium]